MFSVSARDRIGLLHYITNQEEHHRKLTSDEELRARLDEAEKPYDLFYFE